MLLGHVGFRPTRRLERESSGALAAMTTVGWKKDMVEKNVPFLPISGWMSDNLFKQDDSTEKHNMD